MSKFWSKVVHGLTPYTPGEQVQMPGLVKLNTNENPYGPSPKAIAAMREAAGDGLRKYSDPSNAALKAAVARRFGLERAQVFVGNSSDEVLAHTFHALLKHDLPLLAPDISYSFYPTYCSLYGIECVQVPLNERFEIDIDDYKQPCGAIIIANPNAPTGIALTLDQIEALVKAHPDQVVVIDEAYVDFGAQSAAALLDRYDNLLVIQTLSKSRSLAGLRVGFALGHADLIAGLERVKNSFNCYPLGQVQQAGAVAALDDVTYTEQTSQAIIASRAWLTAQMQALGFEVLPSHANFIFTRHPQHDGAQLAKALRERAILVRHFTAARIDQFLRISIGTDEECGKLVEALKAILS
ncbi:MULTISPECIES: histidinol-phosphate transaminase [unclassified Duganella]|uniref:histidinol-phosphate transaminase n=1 Tax=unclassified Duganella TaxID=2636909 RepID=UPI000884602B|nr:MULTISPECIES: histidinol-phosphate transaminase [unclassified Duganella]SDG55812.1 histidinol-phosphate aminotransferase [Duganella sp. OV458]SDJ78620.1 histidinol phosphate aminotransferase apoenzyme [Duganella sp. OV510]